MNRNAAYWIALAFFMLLVLAKFDRETGFTALIRFGETWQERRLSVLKGLPIATVPGSNGYDGQFYAQIALDPLLHNEEQTRALDSPAYRARRILAPATAAILGFRDPWWTLQAYALLNVFCWLALGWILFRQIDQADGRAFARWLGCLFSMGVLESVRQSLVDLPALLLLTIAIYAYQKAQQVRSVAWLTLANLAKETSLLGAFALQGDILVRRTQWRRTTIALLASFLPLVIWSSYVRTRFPATSGAEALGNFSWPLTGFLIQAKQSLREMSFGNFDPRYSFGMVAFAGFVTQAAVLWRRRDFLSPWWRIGAAYSILLIFLSSWVWSGYWAASRALLPMTIAFNLLLPATRAFWPLWMLGNLTLLHAVWRFL